MKLQVFEIEDEDVLETFFGEDARVKLHQDIIGDHGELIYEATVTFPPDVGDVMEIPGSGEEMLEYAVVGRVVCVEDDSVRLIVYQRHPEVPDAQGTS